MDGSGGVAGQYTGKLFAGYGAGVVLVEPPEGTPTRSAAPAPWLFEHLNQGKDSVVVDQLTAAGRATWADLCWRADVVLHDRGRPLPTGLPPTVVAVSVDDFPATGAYRDWRGTEMIHQALSGTMLVTGEPDRPPIYGLGRRAYYARGPRRS